MSRIATLTAVLTMLVAPAAFARQDLRSPDVRDIATPAVVDLRSPDAADPVQAAGQDLRSPDARDVFVTHAASPQATASSDGPAWGYIAIVAAALAACAALVTMLRRHRHIGRPVGV